jgi:tRNA(Ile)-lysidine synthase
MDRLSLKFLPEEHRLLQSLRDAGIKNKKILIAVSGGVDSVVCLALLARLNPVLKNKISVAYVHHGRGTPAQERYRNRALKFVRGLAETYAVPFHTNADFPDKKLKSEDEFRRWRYEHLNKWLDGGVLVLAHQLDDQLETRLLNLIRGSGAKGLQGMSFYHSAKLRPLLIFQRQEVEKLARRLKLKWVEDPSNKKTDPLRNWLRQKWLPQLENKRAGSVARFAHSLENMRQNLPVEILEEQFQNGISRREFIGRSRAEQGALIVSYLRYLKIRDYTHGQVEEILRRLDNGREEFTFTVLKHVWHVSADRFLAVKS